MYMYIYVCSSARAAIENMAIDLCVMVVCLNLVDLFEPTENASQ